MEKISCLEEKPFLLEMVPFQVTHGCFKSKNLKHKTSPPKKAPPRYWSSSFGFGMPYVGREPDLCVVQKCCHQMYGQIWWSNPKKSPEKLGKETCTGDWYLGRYFV